MKKVSAKMDILEQMFTIVKAISHSILRAYNINVKMNRD